MHKPSQRQVQWQQNQWDVQDTWNAEQWIQSKEGDSRQEGDPTVLQPKPWQEKAKEKERRRKSSRTMGLSSHQLRHCWLVGTIPPSNTSSSAMLTNSNGTMDNKEEKERDRHMKSLVAALRRRKDELPEELQSLVKEVTVRSGQEETKILHSAVSQHGRAKKELEEAQAARLHMHGAWKNFLAQSVGQWSKYTEQFMQQERQMMERLKLAQENLLAAKANLGVCKSAAGLESK